MMGWFLFLWLLATLSLLSSARRCVVHSDIVIVRVVDGDTVSVRIPGMPAPLDEVPLGLRILGVDCPESGRRARCLREREMGEAATAFTRGIINGIGATQVSVEICDWDKYGGRILTLGLFCKRSKEIRVIYCLQQKNRSHNNA